MVKSGCKRHTPYEVVRWAWGRRRYLWVLSRLGWTVVFSKEEFIEDNLSLAPTYRPKSPRAQKLLDDSVFIVNGALGKVYDSVVLRGFYEISRAQREKAKVAIHVIETIAAQEPIEIEDILEATRHAMIHYGVSYF